MLNTEIRKIPFLRIIIPFVAGILISEYVFINPLILLTLSVLFILAVIIYRPFLNHDASYHNRWIFGFLLSLVFLFTGAFLTHKSKSYNEKIINSSEVVGIVNEPPQLKPNSIKCEFLVKEYCIDKIWQSTNQKIVLSLEKDSAAASLAYGDLLIVKANLKEIANAGNPSEFDYKKYLARKHIHFKSYQKSDEWKLLSKNRGNIIFSLAYQSREKLLSIFESAGIKGDEFAILAALTLGTKDLLSDELIEAYSDSGAMHVLSVSGLHVGIIFIFLNYLLYFLNNNKKLKIIKALLIISIIWAFAILTGLSPSVNRSAAMITLVILGKVSERKPSAYNSILASAFILLLIDPQFLFDVGFQLSYLAVTALIFFHPRIYHLFDLRNRIMDTLWNWTCVSLSAQIGTTFLSIYYFHQFPVYALLSNLLVVPLSFVIMMLAILLLTFSFFPVILYYGGWCLSKSVWLLNYSVRFFDHLPYSTIEPVSINFTESLLFHLVLFIVTLFIITRNKKFILSSFFVLVIAFLIRDTRYIINRNQQSLIVFNVPRKSAFGFTENGRLNLYVDTILANDSKSINYLVSNVISDKFILHTNVFKLTHKTEGKSKITDFIVNATNFKSVYLMGDYSAYKAGRKLKVKYVIISKNAPMEIEPLLEIFDFDLLIADASVPEWKQQALKKDCLQMAIPFYSVSESGAFLVEYSD
ncbi:MAG: ComEC/Rec2 family competence protein [Bacteroidales bacterium]